MPESLVFFGEPQPSILSRRSYMKAFLIARVSTDEQANSLPAQVYKLKDYALRNDYSYELTEIKESAYKGSREDFKLIIEKIKSCSELVIVVFDKVDRYTRDISSDIVKQLETLYRMGKIELHFPSDNLTITKNSSAPDLMRLGLGMVLAKYYSDAISDNVKRRNEQKRRDGEWCGRAPIGYINKDRPDGKKWVEIDPIYSQAVREAYELYASGNSSLREIAKEWSTQCGHKVGSSKIEQVLKNPFYYGEMRIKGELYPHKYERLITRGLFEQVKAVREGYSVKPHRWGGLPYSFRGLIYCADCGCRITFEKKKKGKYIYGHCTQAKGKHNAKYVPENELIKQMMVIFKKVQIPGLAYQQVSEALRASHEDKKRTYHAQARSIDTEIKKYQTRTEKVYEDYLDEKISEELYNKKFEEYRSKVKLLQERRLNIELTEDTYYSSVSHLLNLAKDAPKLFIKANQEQKRSMINLVLSNLRLDGNQLRWEYKKPFEMMAFCNKSSNWLRRLDSNQ